MAIDNTPPRLRLIATIAAIVIITLFGLNFVFDSYYAFMTDEAKREKLAPTTDRDEQLAAEAASLTGAKVPIEKAMAELKGARPDLVEPKPSDDMAAMTGWSKLPKHAPLAAPGAGMHTPGTPEPETDGGAPHGGGTQATAPDAGKPAVVDAGAPKAPTAVDAGKPKIEGPAAPKGGAAKDAGALAPQ